MSRSPAELKRQDKAFIDESLRRMVDAPRTEEGDFKWVHLNFDMARKSLLAYCERVRTETLKEAGL